MRVRARYHDTNGNVEQSGPWFDPPMEITVSSTPPKEGKGGSNRGRSTNPPAKPAIVGYGGTYFSVLLTWTDPADDTITGYQILRGLDAANLAALTDDTGDATTSYTDDSVSAETTYVYAIRARNAHGVSPQSDPVTVTTGAAPVEPVIARQVDGAEFILDGETLDTTGTCSESDIASIASGCTIDIFDATVPLAVDGTLDAGAGFSIQIARTGAGTLTASSVASAADFPSDGDSVDVTFPAGRNVLAIFYNGTTHYFRVNVVPYWEWDGDHTDCGRHHR